MYNRTTNQKFQDRKTHATRRTQTRLDFSDPSSEKEYLELLNFHRRYGHTEKTGLTLAKYRELDQFYRSAKMTPPGFDKIDRRFG